MSTRIAAYMRANVLGLIAIFIALAGTAYAIDGPLPGQNQVGSEDIINGEVKNNDLGAEAVASGKIADGEVKGADLGTDVIADETLNPLTGSTKVAAGAIKESELGDSSVFSAEVAPNSLTGGDINESTLDSSVVQRRVGGTCAVGSSIRAVSAKGAVTCNPGPAGFYAFDDDTGQICDDNCTELTLHDIPAGTYLIVAKIWIQQQEPGELTSMLCELVAGNSAPDTDTAAFQDFDDDATSATLPMEVVHTFASTDNASINCNDNGVGNVGGLQAKIAAIRLGSVNQR